MDDRYGHPDASYGWSRDGCFLRYLSRDSSAVQERVMPTVYMTIHVPTNRIYVGVHKTDPRTDGYLGSGDRISRVVKKYGISEFKVYVLARYREVQEAYDHESRIVTQEFVDREDTFNLICGGNGFTSETMSYILSDPDTRRRMSKSARRVWRDPVHREKHRKSRKRVMKSNWINPDYRQKKLNSMKRMFETTDIRDRMSRSMSARWEDREFREKHRKSMLRKWSDPVYREKMKTAQKERRIREREARDADSADA